MGQELRKMRNKTGIDAKTWLVGIFVLALSIMAFMPTGITQEADKKEMADKYKGSAHGNKNLEPKVEMGPFVMVFLKRGPAWSAEQSEANLELSAGHMANIKRLSAEGKLALAGPFLDAEKQGDLAGVFVFRTESVDTARAWTETDPAVKAGRFVMEIHPWYGPKSLGK